MHLAVKGELVWLLLLPALVSYKLCFVESNHFFGMTRRKSILLSTEEMQFDLQLS
jgi:hypothetical protein